MFLENSETVWGDQNVGQPLAAFLIAPMASKRAREPQTVDIEDLVPPKTQKGTALDVVELSRRRDVQFKMHEVESMLTKRQWTYPNPMTGQAVHRDLSQLRVLSFFSKDYSNFLELYSRKPQLFSGIALHFGVSINTGLRKQLEPGVSSSFDTMLAQLLQLAKIAQERGQSIPKSLTIHSNDPFVVLTEVESNRDVDNFDQANFRKLCVLLQSLKIRQLHFGWLDTANGWKFVEKRLLKHGYRVRSFSVPEKLAFLETPFAIAKSFGIRMGTCAETKLIGQRIGKTRLRRSICLPFNKIATTCEAICGVKLAPKKHTRFGDKGCNCQRFGDLLSRPAYADPCQHACLYCFSNPLHYPK